MIFFISLVPFSAFVVPLVDDKVISLKNDKSETSLLTVNYRA